MDPTQQQPITNQPQPQPLVQPQPPVAQPVTPTGYAAAPAPIQGGSKFLPILVLVTIAVLGGAGVYMYLSKNAQTTQQPTIPAPVTVAPTAVPSPTSVPDIEQELENVDVGTLEQDFSSLDEDLQSL